MIATIVRGLIWIKASPYSQAELGINRTALEDTRYHGHGQVDHFHRCGNLVVLTVLGPIIVACTFVR
jgi:hypothetical protein